MKNKKYIIIIFGIAILLIDELTNALVIEQNLIVIPNIINITYTENTGMAFGIGQNNLFFIIIINIIVLGIIIKLIKEKQEQIDLKILTSLILILSGGIGNLIDRIFRGYVVDFIDINFMSFPNFNIADISITVGILILIISIIKSMFQQEKT